MPITTITTVTLGELITVPKINDQWQGNISFLLDRPACRIFHSTTQSIADNTETTVTFDSERFDTDNMHSTTTNTSRVTFNTAGVYAITFSGEFTAAADYVSLYVLLRLNGTTAIDLDTRPFATNANVRPSLKLATAYKMAATDYIEVRSLQDNTANVARNFDAVPNRTPELSAIWLCRG